MSAESPTETSNELLARLAHEVSVLVRSELELAAAHHGPQLRHVTVEVAAAVAAAVALILALASAGWAAVHGLSLAMPSWAAALVVAAAWSAVAGLLLSLDHPRRLFARLREESGSQAIERAEQARAEAEHDVKATAERLGIVLARESAEREIRIGVTAAERFMGTAEDDAEDLLKELVVALLAPGKAGISLIERLMGRRPAP